MILSRLRLASGMVLFAFVFGHLTNHTLGLISLDAMERGTAFRICRVLDFWLSHREPVSSS